MTYIVIFNGQKYVEETIKVADWLEFTRMLNRLVQIYNEAPHLIYLKSIKD
jgi:hypothetical protein